MTVSNMVFYAQSTIAGDECPDYKNRHRSAVMPTAKEAFFGDITNLTSKEKLLTMNHLILIKKMC